MDRILRDERPPNKSDGLVRQQTNGQHVAPLVQQRRIWHNPYDPFKSNDTCNILQ